MDTMCGLSWQWRCCSRPACGQTVAVAQLSGTVVDESGAALPGAEVTVTQTDTGMTRFVITNERGGYVFTNLPVGPYKLAAQDERLQQLRADRHRARRWRHAVGECHAESWRAVGNGQRRRGRHPGRDARHRRRQGGRAGADRQPAAQRPGRQPAHHSGGRRRPGRRASPTTDSTRTRCPSRSRAAPATARSIWWTAAPTTIPQNNTGNAMPFPDALQEFSVESGVRSARFGMSTGATVNAVTRSGTNSFHGSGFVLRPSSHVQCDSLLRAHRERRAGTR